MHSRGGETRFEEADRLYTDLKRRYDAGALSFVDFDAKLREIMVQDDRDRWWAKSRRTGAWHYHDGQNWVPGTPPGTRPPQTAPPATLPGPKPSGAGTQERVDGAAVTLTYSARRRTAAWFWVVGGVVVALILAPALSRDGSGGEFKDDFSSVSSGWADEKLSGGSSIGYGINSYEISAEGSDYAYATAPAGTYRDVVVQAHAATHDGVESGSSWGVICRLDSPEDFYVMGSYDDGDGFIGKVESGAFSELARSSSVEIGRSGVLRGHCIGDSLSLYMDSEKVVEAMDSDYAAGEVGLWTKGSNASANTNLSFDDFSASHFE